MATLDEIHEVQFQMFQYFDHECDKHGLRYCMVAGTLLGAVRHKGFIPWDDDIDVFMPMEDAKVLEASFRSDKYFLQTPRTDHEMPYIMFRLRKNQTYMPQLPVEENINIHKGVWMDLFLYTNAASSSIGKKIQLKLMHALQSFRCRYYHAVDHQERKIFLLLSRFPRQLSLFIDNFLLGCIKLAGSKNSREYFVMDVREPYFFKKSFLDNRKRYCFEGGEFWGVKDSDEYLRLFYGDDYMTPDRWSHIEDYSNVIL